MYIYHGGSAVYVYSLIISITQRKCFVLLIEEGSNVTVDTLDRMTHNTFYIRYILYKIHFLYNTQMEILRCACMQVLYMCGWENCN